jgi:septum formation protein
MNHQIILASQSPHRKKLLRQAGLRFRTVVSRAQETNETSKGCAYLVKGNALKKAKEVAGRLKRGIVISADTVVCTRGGHIIGKPRDLKEAKRNLKKISRHPQWLYTGVAIIDIEKKKTLVSFEKTKIMMTSLTDQEIDHYYQKTSPFDKAGGFDIEGRGALFIKRIEGCYYNVIGLPLAKLRVMLKSFGINLLSLMMCVLLFGCVHHEYNLATQQQETYLVSTEREIAVGESVARHIEEQFTINTDLDLNERVSKIAERITAVCDRTELVYTVRIIDHEEEVNAFALPGGFIYLFKKLIDNTDSDDEIAGVIAHEIGHITARHAIKRMQAQHGYNLLMALSVATGQGHMAGGVHLAFASVISAYSRQDEMEADTLAVRYLERAGYDPMAIATFLEKLLEINANRPSRSFSYWRTHPYTSQRIAIVTKKASGEMSFRDYIRLTQEEEKD